MLRVFLDVKDNSKVRATLTHNCATESLLDNPNKSSPRTYGKIAFLHTLISPAPAVPSVS